MLILAEGADVESAKAVVESVAVAHGQPAEVISTRISGAAELGLTAH